MNHLARPPLHVVLELVRAAEAANPRGVAAGEWNRYLLRNPDDSGCYEDGQFLWNQAAAELAATSDAAAAGEAVERLAAAMRRFIDTAGWAPIAARIRDARAAGRAVCLTVRSAAHEIYTLPWELLDLDGTALCEIDACLLRYQCPEPAQESPPEPLAEPLPEPGGRVLVAWSGGVLAGEHIEAVAAAARAGHVRFDRGRDVLAHASLAGIEAALRERPVTILHLLCHGQALAGGRAHGLVLDGASEPVPPAALRDALAPHRHSLRLVVLSACLGGSAGAIDNELGSVAQAVLEAGVPAVIAARYPLSMTGSVLLAQTLYQRLLVDLWSLERAFLAARAALRDQTPGAPRSLDLVALQLHVRSARSLDFRPWVIQPYRGLSVYDRDDARLFFGRDEERALLLRRMAGMLARGAPRLLLVAGASGTGKSSLVRAGVLGDLVQGRLSAAGAGETPGTVVRDPWATAVLRPGEGRAPLDRLRQRVAEHGAAPAGTRLALVVDQLEELFTEISDPAQREAFLRALWGLACDPGSGVFVIATIRIDYLGHLGTVRVDDAGATFDRALLDDERYYLVRQLGPEQYERIIRGPAEAAGGLIEPGLLERLLDAQRAEPGALPLLSYTLDQLWQQRSFASQEIRWSCVAGTRAPGAADETAIVTGWWLTDAAYSALGGIGGALARSADALHAELAPAHQAELRRVLVQLVHDHDDPMLATRRRGWRQALRPGDGSARVYDQVVDALVDARLLVQGSAGGAGDPVWIELAHDALIRFWPRLRQWHQEARAWLAHADELRRLAEDWQPRACEGGDAAGRASEEPYLTLRGQRLSYHLEAWGRYHEQLGVQEQRLGRAFLDACVRAERERVEAERGRELAARRRARLAALVAVLVAAVMSALGLWARGQQHEAEAQRAEAEQQRAEAEAQRVRAETSLVTARDALLMTGARELITRGQATWATRLLESVSQPFDVHAWRAVALEALSQAWLISTLRGHEDRIREVAFSPDGTLVATASHDGTARVWRADGTGVPLVLRHDGKVHAVAFSPDGQRVATASEDGAARVWRVDGAGEPLVLRHEGEVFAVAFSPDGTLVVSASADDTARLWRVGDGGQVAALRGHDGRVYHAVFSPDGKLVVTGAGNGTIRVWRLDDLERPQVLPDRGELVMWIDFNPQGTIMASGGSGGTLGVWWLDSLGSPVTLGQDQTRRGAMVSGGFSPDGRRIITASLGGLVEQWNLDGPEPVDELDKHVHAARVAAFSPDGRHHVTAFADGTVHLWRLTSRKPLRAVRTVLAGHEDSVLSAAFSPDGKRLVTVSVDATARIWHVADPDRFFTTLHAQHRVNAAAFSADGTLVLMTTGAREAQVWRADGSGLVARIGEEAQPVAAAALSPDGERVATVAPDGRLSVWRVRDASHIATVPGKVQEDLPVQFSPDGTLLLTVSRDDIARLWRADDLALLAASPAHGYVSSAAFSPDGKLAITSTQDGAAHVWAVPSLTRIGILGEHRGSIGSMSFSADGRRVLINASGEIRVWSIDAPAQPMMLRRLPRSDADAVLSPDGARIITTDEETAKVQGVDEREPVIALRGHRAEIYMAAFSPDGEMALTVSGDGETRIWSLDAPDQSAVLAGREWAHSAAAFSPDGERVLTKHIDGTVRITPIDFEGLKASLDRASTECLTAEMRQRYMGEAATEARRGYEECERGYGRVPRPPRTSGPETAP